MQTRLTVSVLILVILTGCQNRQEAEETIDLGGGISLTKTGQVLGATPARPMSLPSENEERGATRFASGAPGPASAAAFAASPLDARASPVQPTSSLSTEKKAPLAQRHGGARGDSLKP
jgi:hypothetical protein